MDPLILSMDGFYGGCDSVLFFKGIEPMDTGQDQPVLEQTPASREWVETLFASGHIDRTGRQAALDILHPRGAWQAWLSQLLLILGAVLSLTGVRSEEHTSELQSRTNLVCRLLLEKKNKKDRKKKKKTEKTGNLEQ